MAEIVNIANTIPVVRFPIEAGSRPNSSAPVAEPGKTSDQVEISDLGKAFADLQAASSYNAAKIHAIRKEIADGKFETPERIKGTVDRLFETLR